MAIQTEGFAKYPNPIDIPIKRQSRNVSLFHISLSFVTVQGKSKYTNIKSHKAENKSTWVDKDSPNTIGVVAKTIPAMRLVLFEQPIIKEILFTKYILNIYSIILYQKLSQFPVYVNQLERIAEDPKQYDLIP